MTLGWPPGRPRVLVVDGWLGDAGEGATALAVDRMIRSVAPGAAVLHAARLGSELGGLIPGLNFVPPLASLVGVGRAAPTGATFAAGRDLVRGADLVVSQGGPALVECPAAWTRLDAYQAVLEMGRPMVLLGLSLGPWRAAAGRALLRRVLKSAVAVTVRDQRSLAFAVDLGAPGQRLTLAGDVVFTLFPDPPPLPAGKGVALAVGAAGEEVPAARLLAEVAARTDGERLTVFSTIHGPGPDPSGVDDGARDDAHRDDGRHRDGAAAAALAKMVAALDDDARARVDIVEGAVGPLQAIELAASHRAVVSMHLRPALFAWCQGVPAALVPDAAPAGVLDGTDLGPAVCAAVDEAGGLGQRAAVAAALDPAAAKGAALWHALAPARHRAELNAAVLAGAIAELRRAGSSAG